MTSRGAAGFTVDSAPPVQYIHIPKTGGTTLQQSLKENLRRRGRTLDVDNTVDLAKRRAECREDKNMHVGQYFAGHVPIGHFSQTFRTQSPIYVVVVREPVSLLISLYDYRGTYQISRHTLPDFEQEVRELQARDASLARQGVPEDARLDNLLSRGVEYMHDFKYYYYPCTCGVDYDNRTAVEIAMHNLLRIDVVAVLEDVGTLVPQLEFHMPWLRPFSLLATKNKAARPSQKLSQESLRAVMSGETYVTESRVYEFAKVVAKARADFVDQCQHQRGSHQPEGGCPADETMVPIELDPAVFTTLEATRDFYRDKNCLVPPPDGQAWPAFVW